MLGEHDLVLQGGEAVEFDTRVPHWFDRAGPEAVELLSLFGHKASESTFAPDPREIHDRDRSKRVD